MRYNSFDRLISNLGNVEIHQQKTLGWKRGGKGTFEEIGQSKFHNNLIDSCQFVGGIKTREVRLKEGMRRKVEG